MFILQLIKKCSDFFKLFLRRFFIAEGAHDELLGRATEYCRDDLVDNLLLHLRLRMGCSIEMKLAALLACHDSLFVHDLKKLQNSGIPVGGFATEGFMYFAHR